MNEDQRGVLDLLLLSWNEGNDQRKGAAMPTGIILLLGAFAGLTIYLGLPLAFLQRTPQSLKVLLTMLATGVLVFLLFDVLSHDSLEKNTRRGAYIFGGTEHGKRSE